MKPILLWPHPTLKKVSKEVTPEQIASGEIDALIASMRASLARNGVGLAAIQIGVPLRVFVAKNSKDELVAYINPVVVETIDEPRLVQEGCLSIPGVYEDVLRFPEVVITSQDASGEEGRWQFEGIEAQCVQHEIEHLDGMLFVDQFGPVKQGLLKKKVQKWVRRSS